MGNDSPKVLIATPTYDGRVCNARAIKDACDPRWPYEVVDYLTVRSSLLCFARNSMWCEALNLHIKNACTHIVFLDADVEPMVPNWLGFMLEEMSRTKAAVLGAVIPLKDDSDPRETSHAIYKGGWEARRLNSEDLQCREDTWTEPGLLVSTGLMLIDLRLPWSMHFTIKDQIVWKNDRFEPEVWPEDWNFCRDCHDRNLPVWATKIPIVHWDGGTAYRLEI